MNENSKKNKGGFKKKRKRIEYGFYKRPLLKVESNKKQEFNCKNNSAKYLVFYTVKENTRPQTYSKLPL